MRLAKPLNEHLSLNPSKSDGAACQPSTQEKGRQVGGQNLDVK
jgi:hypothetical protein